MKIAIGADHAGFEMKEELKRDVEAAGHDVFDLGAFEYDALDDYPDFAREVAKAVVSHETERGIIICGSGIGASIAANKVKGIRAGVVYESYAAHQGVEHDDMNVLVLGSRVVGIEVAREALKSFLGAQFSGEERHVRRLNKVLLIEEENS
jgi:ribose 5-phosphate isomerase B